MNLKHLKAVILIAGPQKGTRFRPLSIDVPKVLFPVAGIPMIQHHIEACSKIPEIKEILIIGYYLASELDKFVQDMIQLYNVHIRYLQEFEAMGTAGGIFHFRDQIMAGSPDAFILLNGDICAEFDIFQLIDFHNQSLACRSSSASQVMKSTEKLVLSMMATKANPIQSINYGCLVRDDVTEKLLHYVEKPNTYVSSLVNCGIYVINMSLFPILHAVFTKKHERLVNGAMVGNRCTASMSLEREVLSELCDGQRVAVYVTKRWWSPIKTPAAAIYANRHYLQLYEEDVVLSAQRLVNIVDKENFIGKVFMNPTAKIHPTAVIGPNVSIAANVVISQGARVKEAILLQNSFVGPNSLVMYAVIGIGSQIGSWTRVEGTRNEPNPNEPFTRIQNAHLFNSDGRLTPSITVLGSDVSVANETILINSIVLPHKQLSRSFKNEVVL